ncbi:MAG: geranylgeranyl reductase family protein [Bdellovibrionota bacterium]
MSGAGKKWDVIVVGAGPGGSSTAFFLAKAGIQVLLLDRVSFPRDKVCGDGCTPRTARMLDRLGVRQAVAKDYPRIDRARLVSPGGIVVDSPIPEVAFGGVGYALPRYVLDNLLLENATRAGAEFRGEKAVRTVESGPGGAAVVLESGERLAGSFVVGADGAYSVVRRSLGLEPNGAAHGAWAIRAYYEGVEMTAPNAFEICWDKELLPAYGWLFPVGPGRANVGLGLRTDHLKRLDRKLPDLFEEFLRRDPNIGAELKNARLIGKPRGHFLPLGSQLPRTYGERVVLVGDAASFINPLSGEGIEFALESGELAAATLAEGLRRGEFSASFLKGYEKGWRKAFGHTLRVNTRLQWFFQFPRMVDRIFRVANRDERTKNELADLILGDRRRLSLRLIWKFLFG